MSERNQWLAVAGAVALVLALATGWKWYEAGVQRDVYARQGVRMTTWEVFVGAKPVERYVREAP